MRHFTAAQLFTLEASRDVRHGVSTLVYGGQYPGIRGSFKNFCLQFTEGLASRDVRREGSVGAGGLLPAFFHASTFWFTSCMPCSFVCSYNDTSSFPTADARWCQLKWRTNLFQPS